MTDPSIAPRHLDGIALVLFGLLCSLVGGVTYLVPDLFTSALLLWGGLLVGVAGVCWYGLVRTLELR